MILPDHTYLEIAKFQQSILAYKAYGENGWRNLICMIGMYNQYHKLKGYIYKIKDDNGGCYIGKADSLSRLSMRFIGVKKKNKDSFPLELNNYIINNGLDSVCLSIVYIKNDDEILENVEFQFLEQCRKHGNYIYNKNLYHLMPQTPSTIEELVSRTSRILHIPITNGELDYTKCWLGLGKLGTKGYKLIEVENTSWPLHKYIATALIRIELNDPNWTSGVLQWDHLCSNKHCCNPQHGEFVSNKVNMERRQSGYICKYPRSHNRVRMIDRTRRSKYIGVYKYEKTNRYQPKAKLNGKVITLGCFDDEKLAAQIRDQYVIDNNLWTIEHNVKMNAYILLNRYLFPEDFE